MTEDNRIICLLATLIYKHYKLALAQLFNMIFTSREIIVVIFENQYFDCLSVPENG